jgi:hypothetical protein
MLKSKHFLIAAMACAISVGAFATGSHTPPTPPPTASPPGASADSAASSDANATAGAMAGAAASVGDVNAAGGASTATANGGGGGTGGAGGNAVSGPSYAASELTSSNQGGGASIMDQSSSKMYVFPAPVWTQAPRPFGCIVTNSKAGSLGWNLVSYSETLQTPEVVCTTLRMVDAALLHCHFQTAEMLNQRAYRTMFPDEAGLPTTPGIRNLSLAECEAIRNPRMVMTASMAPPPPPAPVACIAPPVKKKVRLTKKRVLPACVK